VLDCLDLADLLNLAATSRTLNDVVGDDDAWWMRRYAADLGEHKQTIVASERASTRSCGWSMKQRLCYDLVALLGAHAASPGDAFALQRDVWLSTCRERRRKTRQRQIAEDEGDHHAGADHADAPRD
jgi:hypothetical protein